MKWSLETTLMFAVMLLIAMLIAVGLGTMPTAEAKPPTDWKVASTGKVLDVDPLAPNGSVGLFFEMSDNRWLWIWQDNVDGSWPSRGNHGVWHKREVKGKSRYRWTDTKIKVAAKKTAPKKAVASQVISTSSSWQSISIGLPPINKTMLVRYANGKTITTAYVNNKKQWKLETDRDRISGGRTILTIKEWRVIPE